MGIQERLAASFCMSMDEMMGLYCLSYGCLKGTSAYTGLINQSINKPHQQNLQVYSDRVLKEQTNHLHHQDEKKDAKLSK